MKIRKKLNKIKNYKDYFIINDLTLCNSSKLTKSDLNNFKKCTALPKSNITRKNINSSLHKIMALNIPDGGIAVDDYIAKIYHPFKDFKELNYRLVDLLLHGIIPMNEKHIYHNDIKPSNVLVKSIKHKILTRLIDWGVSTEYIPFQNNKIPSVLQNKPLQYNLPFSLILFAEDFNTKYTKFIEKKKEDHLDPKRLKLFMKKYIHYWIKIRGKGHYPMIRHVISILHNTQNRKEERNISSSTLETYDSSTEITTNSEDVIKDTIEDDNAIRIIINYIIPILIEFTEGNSLNLDKYLNNVYIHLVDIYGFINIYCPLLEILYKNFTTLTENQLLIFELIKGLYIRYLYSPTNKPINIEDLIKDLKELDNLLHHEQ
jgi:serine/threonine protein kinase